MRKLVIKDLHVAVGDKEILKGIDLTVNSNEIHALMGPNGNGKSTFGPSKLQGYSRRNLFRRSGCIINVS